LHHNLTNKKKIMENEKEVVTSEPETTVVGFDSMKGSFVESLRRNNSKIKQDRAAAIAEDAELIYKREVEDLEMQIRQIKRERNSMLDLSPTNTDSLVLASDFNSKAFVNKDLELGVKMRNLEIKLEIAKARYRELFM
jgi:hypothetical protein